MKKKFLASLMCATLAVGTLTACSGGSEEAGSDAAETTEAADDAAAEEESDDAAEVEPAEDAITLTYAEVNPEDSLIGQVAVKFKEEVEARSNGSIIIDLQAGGVLGSENDVLDTMLGGGDTIDIARISAFALTSYGGEKSKLLSLPYTFVNRDHFWNFANSDLAQEFLQEPVESGVRGLFYGEEGFRHFFTASEISSIDDLSGMKLRVSNDPVMNGLVEGLGGSPTVVDFGELYSALQTGVVDGAEQPIANYQSNAFPEVAPYMILDGHTLGAVQVVITNAAWDSLTEEQQTILEEAGKATSAYNQEIAASAEQTCLDEMKADGVTFIEVDDIAPWQEATKAVIEENTAGMEDLYQQILDMQ